MFDPAGSKPLSPDGPSKGAIGVVDVDSEPTGNRVNEKELIRRCQTGDESAFREVCDRHAPRMLQVAEGLLGRREDAEDAVQQAFVRLYERIGSFRGDSTLGTFLYRILVNACHDLRRRRPRAEFVEWGETMNAHHPDLELRVRLQSAINHLPERMRTCFVLFAVNDMKQSEVAEALGVTVGAVKAHIHQAKAWLRPGLREHRDPVHEIRWVRPGRDGCRGLRTTCTDLSRLPGIRGDGQATPAGDARHRGAPS